MTGYSDDELTERYDDDESFDRARAIRISQLLQEVAEVQAREQSLLAEVERQRAELSARQAENRVVHENFAAIQAENAALREIVQAVASGQTRHVAEADRWVLAFDNPTLSYAQTIWQQARALLGKEAQTEE